MLATVAESAIITDYSTSYSWFAAIALKPFSVKVKDLWFVPTVILLLKIRLTLDISLQNLGN